LTCRNSHPEERGGRGGGARWRVWESHQAYLPTSSRENSIAVAGEAPFAPCLIHSFQPPKTYCDGRGAGSLESRTRLSSCRASTVKQWRNFYFIVKKGGIFIFFIFQNPHTDAVRCQCRRRVPWYMWSTTELFNRFRSPSSTSIYAHHCCR
jgi:hypothetical protein